MKRQIQLIIKILSSTLSNLQSEILFLNDEEQITSEYDRKAIYRINIVRIDPNDRRKKKKIVLSSTYKLIVIAVLSLNIMFFITMVSLAFWGDNPMSDAQKILTETCRELLGVGFGAFVGLLGGKIY